MAVTHTTTFRNIVADLVGSGCNAGKLVFRITGSSANGVASAVASLTMSATAFGAAASGTATANTITANTSAAGGVAAFATFEGAAATVMAHVAVAPSGSDIDFSNGVTVTAGDTVSCSALSYTAMP